MISELKRLLDQVSKDKGIDKDVLIQTLEEAIKTAANKKLGSMLDLEVTYNDEYGEIESFQFKDVVENVEDPQMQISLEEARSLDPEVELDDSIGVKLDTSEFGRIAAQTAKQVIIQKVKEAERDLVYEDYKDKKGQTIRGLVQRFDRGAIIVTMGLGEAVLPVKEQIPRERYKQGDRIKAYVFDVRRVSHGPQIILSRTHPQFLLQLFIQEVPEISEGIVTVSSVAREPGVRAKIAVSSKDPDVDPVGACVGMRGTRVQAVVQELRGEKIDIIEWSPDPAKFVCNAVAPAQVSLVVMDRANNTMELVVPDDQLSLAIGRKGQNIKLAAKLTGWDLDVYSESRYAKLQEKGYQALTRVEGVGENTADVLFDAGIKSPDDLAASSIEDIIKLPGISETRAEALINAAKNKLKEEDEKEDSIDSAEEPIDTKSSIPVEDKQPDTV